MDPAAGPWRPRRPVDLIAGTPPGGGQDRAARALAAALDPRLDVPVGVVNVPGLGGGNAWAELGTRPGDGHRLAISSPTLLTNPITGITDLAWTSVTQLALLYTEYIALAVPAASPIAAAAGLIERLHHPDRLPIAMATARGNINHMALARLCRHAGSDPGDLSLRVFDSARDAIADGLAGNAAAVAVTAASVLPELEVGALRVLAVSAPARLSAPFATVPAWSELGVDCILGTWRGVVGPPGLAANRVRFWEETIATATADSAWQQQLAAKVWSPTYLDAAATATFLGAQQIEMQATLTDLGLIDG